MNMKKTVLMFAAAGLMLATPSCKKGENDPFLSLSSRKSRVAGEWNITGYEFTDKSTESDGDYFQSSGALSGNTLTITNTQYDASSATTTTSTTTVTLDEGSYTFEKDGTWSATMNTTSVSVMADYPFTDFTTTNTTVTKESFTGNWSFVGKLKGEYKGKERIVLNTLTRTGSDQTTSVTVDDNGVIPTQTNVGDTYQSTDNYLTGEVQETWDIDQLKGKEMVVMMEGSQSGTYSITPNGGSTTTYTNDVETSSTKITFTAK